MIVGYHPFIPPQSSDISEKEILDNVVGCAPEIPSFVSKEAAHIIKLVLILFIYYFHLLFPFY